MESLWIAASCPAKPAQYSPLSISRVSHNSVPTEWLTHCLAPVPLYLSCQHQFFQVFPSEPRLPPHYPLRGICACLSSCLWTFPTLQTEKGNVSQREPWGSCACGFENQHSCPKWHSRPLQGVPTASGWALHPSVEHRETSWGKSAAQTSALSPWQACISAVIPVKGIWIKANQIAPSATHSHAEAPNTTLHLSHPSWYVCRWRGGDAVNENIRQAHNLH